MPSTRIEFSNSDNEKDENVSEDKLKTFDLTEKVEYNDFIQENLPEEIIFPEELNRFLRDQIRELTAQNGRLRRSLEECEEKYENLIRKNSSQTVENLSSLPLKSVVRASDLAASKIIELSKKCREQTSEIEALKSKCKILDSKLLEINKIEEIKTSTSDSGDGSNFGPLTIEEELKNKEELNKNLQEKIYQINSKLYESKNTCTSLRQELNKAQKLLFREVGENLTIASLSSRQQLNTWKGRAEQIKQLQNKLNEYEGNSSKGSSVTILEKRNIDNLRKIEKERRQKAEDSADELIRITKTLELCKKRQEASKARVKVLENDLNSAKQNVVLLNEKRSHDEQLIQALNGQLKLVEEKYRDREKDLLIKNERSENELIKMCSELNNLKSLNENYQRLIEERETEIETLKNIVAGEKENPMKTESPISLSRGKFNRQSSLNSQFFTPKISNGDHNEYVTLGIAAEAERERLLELVIVLNRRLEEERFVTDKTNETLRVERNKLARLETKLQRLEMERVGISKVNTGYKPRSRKSSTISMTRGVERDDLKDENRFRLELLEEECLALKTRLATVQRDKASDLSMYKQMLDQARKTFQDAYRGKPGSCSYSTVTI